MLPAGIDPVHQNSPILIVDMSQPLNEGVIDIVRPHGATIMNAF